MGDSFSRRKGLGRGANTLVYDKASLTLRIGFWNLIEDLVNHHSLPIVLPDYVQLYRRITSRFRIKRVEGIDYNEGIKSMVLSSFKWNEIFDSIEFLFQQVSYFDWDERERDFVTHAGLVGTARYNYTIMVNELLSSENIGWKLKKGELERIGSEIIDREVIEITRQLLKGRRFAGPNKQFDKALGFFNKRPAPDLENCVKDAVGALEGLVRILLDDKYITLGDGTKNLVGKSVIRKPLDRTFHALYGFVSSEPGSRHGAFDLSSLDIPEAELVLYNSAVCMLFLAKKFGISPPAEEGTPLIDPDAAKVPDSPDGDDDIPF